MSEKPRAQSPKWDRLDVVRLKSGGPKALVRAQPDESGEVMLVWCDTAGHLVFSSVNEDWIEEA